MSRSVRHAFTKLLPIVPVHYDLRRSRMRVKGLAEQLWRGQLGLTSIVRIDLEP